MLDIETTWNCHIKELTKKWLSEQKYQAHNDDDVSFSLNERGTYLTIMRFLKNRGSRFSDILNSHTVLNSISEVGAYLYSTIRLGRLSGPSESRFEMVLSGCGPNFYDPPVVKNVWEACVA
jgi:hypothetical protein